MNCKDFREIADSYLSEELLVETNHEVLRHLEACADCREVLAARRSVREQLRNAIRSAPESQINPGFAARLESGLREDVRGRKPWLLGIGPAFAPAMGALAVLILAVLIGGVWFINRDKEDITSVPPVNIDVPKSQQSAFQKISYDAADNHKYCALEHSIPDNPISLKEAAVKFGKFNAGLDKAVIEPLKKTFGKDIKFIDAHSCIVNGRRFAHVILERGGKLVSVMVARREDEKALEDSGAISCQSGGGFQMSCFDAGQYRVFVVSELTEADNLQTARALQSEVAGHILRNNA